MTSPPAFAAFDHDPAVGRLAHRLYRHLQSELLDFREPRPVKVRGLAGTLHAGTSGVMRSLNWLVARGYLVEHDRGSRGIRSFTMAWIAKPSGDCSRNKDGPRVA
jgi:hypothetical protein